MSLLNPLQFFKRQPLEVQVSTGARIPPPVDHAGFDPRSEAQRAADQQKFDTQGLPSRLPRHRA